MVETEDAVLLGNSGADGETQVNHMKTVTRGRGGRHDFKIKQETREQLDGGI